MSLSQPVLPPVRLAHTHTPRLDPATRALPNPERDPRSMIRLPSYKELTAASNCADLPPRTAAAATARSSLFTAGLIHLPPLKVPNGPPVASGSKSRFYSHSNSNTPNSHQSHHNSNSNSNSNSTSTSNSNSNDEDDASNGRRYLDLSLHCPLPSQSQQQRRDEHQMQNHGQRVTSPYSADSLSAESTDMERDGDYGQPHPNNQNTSPWTAPPPSLHHPSSHPSSLHLSSPHPHLSSSPHLSSHYNNTDAQAQPPRLKFSHAKAGGRTKKQALSCFFCRERKIACGRPDPEAQGGGNGGNGNGGEGTCNQCARRKIECRYPTVSHRGQHSRIKSAARKGLGLAYAGLAPPSNSYPPDAQQQYQGMGMVSVGREGS